MADFSMVLLDKNLKFLANQVPIVNLVLKNILDIILENEYELRYFLSTQQVVHVSYERLQWWFTLSKQVSILVAEKR